MSSYYMTESTYRHDFGKSQNSNFSRPFPQTSNNAYYDTTGMYKSKYSGYGRVKDDFRVPLNQGRGYADRRQDGPYTDRGDYGRLHDDRYKGGPYTDRQGYDDKRQDGSYTDRGDYGRHHDDRYNGGPYTERQAYERRPDDRAYQDRRYDRTVERQRQPERPIYEKPPSRYEEVQMYDRFGNRTTQKDYGDFETRPRGPVDRPRPYRGEVDKELDAFHNKANEYTQTETPDTSKQRDKYIDDIYLRPEEKKVRHRNMEYEYDAQQRLPLYIAPQNDYKGNIDRLSRVESGAYLFIRAQAAALSDVKKSFQRHKSILKMSGHLKGIALPNTISVMGDFSNWHIKSPMVRKGEYWYEQAGGGGKGIGEQEYSTDYIILCLWFPTVDSAKTWIHYDLDFKISSFPEPYGVEMLICQINYIPINDTECNTFVMTEYPDIVDKEGLIKHVKDPIEQLLTKDSTYSRCEPFVVWTDRIIMERGMWVTSRSMMAIHRFASLKQAREFLNDPRVERIKRELKYITKGGRHTTVLFQLVDFV